MKLVSRWKFGRENRNCRLQADMTTPDCALIAGHVMNSLKDLVSITPPNRLIDTTRPGSAIAWAKSSIHTPGPNYRGTLDPKRPKAIKDNATLQAREIPLPPPASVVMTPSVPAPSRSNHQLQNVPASVYAHNGAQLGLGPGSAVQPPVPKRVPSQQYMPSPHAPQASYRATLPPAGQFMPGVNPGSPMNGGTSPASLKGMSPNAAYGHSPAPVYPQAPPLPPLPMSQSQMHHPYQQGQAVSYGVPPPGQPGFGYMNGNAGTPTRAGPHPSQSAPRAIGKPMVPMSMGR